nr:MAG TPA: hypothetical protein [Caudoviricetes sp.]
MTFPAKTAILKIKKGAAGNGQPCRNRGLKSV